MNSTYPYDRRNNPIYKHIDIAEKTKADAMKKIDDAWGM